jgi:hypothetical protein
VSANALAALVQASNRYALYDFGVLKNGPFANAARCQHISCD